jgi:hypothetical protein
VNIPINGDLSVSMVRWAAEVLGETPELLRVSPEEDHAREIADIDIVIDPALSKWAWVLQGPTREVYSDGA